MSAVYSFDFLCADALTLTYTFLTQFDLIHASPPCQAYSKISPRPERHPRLIAAIHQMLYAAGKPYVIENVEGSGRELRPNVVINGGWVRLPIERKRYFHVSWLINDHRCLYPSAHHINFGRNYNSREQLLTAFGLQKLPSETTARMTRRGISQGIPPDYILTILDIHEPLHPNDPP